MGRSAHTIEVLRLSVYKISTSTVGAVLHAARGSRDIQHYAVYMLELLEVACPVAANLVYYTYIVYAHVIHVPPPPKHHHHHHQSLHGLPIRTGTVSRD